MDLTNVKILGTSHISPQSIKQVQEGIVSWKPDIVCVELDKGRLQALISGQRKISFKDIKTIGMLGFILAKFGAWGSKKLGKMVGTTPGDEMKAAVFSAKKNKLKLFLIDQPVHITLKKFSKAFSWKERLLFVWDIGMSPFKKKKINFDLHSSPDTKLVKELTQMVRERYPSLYNVLIEERNLYMARALAKIMKKYPEEKIFVVVGAGHVEGMTDALKRRFE